MTSESDRLRSDRADEVERKLRAPADQLKPTEQLKSPTTALGLCHSCKTIVYAGDDLAMAGIYLYHGGCAGGTGPTGAT